MKSNPSAKGKSLSQSEVEQKPKRTKAAGKKSSAKKAAPKKPVKARQLEDGSWDTPTGKHPGGAPRKFETAEEFEIAIEEYFDDCDEKGKPYTITGLALACGFASRQSIFDYGKSGEFSYLIKKAKMRVEISLEERLSENAPAGTIFNLKNNFGWKDKQEVDHGVQPDNPLASILSGLSGSVLSPQKDDQED